MSGIAKSTVETIKQAGQQTEAVPIADRAAAIAAMFKAAVNSGVASAVDPDLPPIAHLRPHVEWPYGFAMTDGGLVYDSKEGPPMTLSGHFDVHAMVRTEEGTGWATAISFRDPDNRLHVVMVSRADLASGEAADLRRELATKGLRLGSGRSNRERFAAGLAGLDVSTRALFVGKAGWHQGGTVYASPSFTDAVDDRAEEPIIFRSDPGTSRFRAMGDLDTWRSRVAALAVGQDRLLFALSIAFAGPLIEPMGQDSGCFNFVGASSTGKTSALRLAGSVWGGGGPLGFAATWRTTSNALEGVCAQHNDSFLGLDELGVCPPNEVEAAAYALAGGNGKSRLKSDGDLRVRLNWRVMVLSTAEITLAQHIAEGGSGRAVKAGQTVRFIDLPADAGRGLGLFDHVEGFGGAARLADAIRDRTDACYGVAGAAFVGFFLRNREASVRLARKVIVDFVSQHVPEGASGQVHRVADRFGFVAAAGELAASYGILPVEPGAATAAAGSLFRLWLDERGGAGSSEARSAVTQVRHFLLKHAPARFMDAGPGFDATVWRAQNLAGFRLYEDGRAGDFCLTDPGFLEAVAGLNARASADALNAAGFLVCGEDGRRKANVWVGGRSMRVYRIRVAIVDGEEG